MDADLSARLDKIDQRLTRIERMLRTNRPQVEGRVRYTRKDVTAIFEHLAGHYGFTEPLNIMRQLGAGNIVDIAPADYGRAYKMAEARIKEIECRGS